MAKQSCENAHGTTKVDDKSANLVGLSSTVTKENDAQAQLVHAVSEDYASKDTCSTLDLKIF